MAPGDKLTPKPAKDANCLLALRRSDGSVTSVGPLSRDRAEALVESYARPSSEGTCWVEPLRPEVEELHVGRVRRVGRPAVPKASQPDH